MKNSLSRATLLVAAATLATLMVAPMASSAANLSSSSFAIRAASTAQSADQKSLSSIKPAFRAGSTAPEEPPVAPSDFSTRMSLNTALSNCLSPFSITIPATKLQPDAVIDWGDGSKPSKAVAGANSHIYAAKAQYKLEITGTLEGLRLGNGSYGSASSANCVPSIDHFGADSGMTSLYLMLGSSQNTKSVAAPPTTVTDMSYMFYQARGFAGDISGWDVSRVANFSNMFRGHQGFKGDLSKWDVGSAVNMSNMFNQATNFNSDLSGWRPAKATNMAGMFSQAYAFNQNLNSWPVGNVTDFSDMFWNATVFNSPMSNWDVSKATDVSSMLQYASNYRQDLSSWDLSKVSSANKYKFADGAKLTGAPRGL